MDTQRKEQLSTNFNRQFASKKRLLIFTFVHLVGSFFMLASASNLFTESPFQRQYLVFFLLIAVNTFMVVRGWKAYAAQKK
jgi:hypothetical protein